MLVKLCSLNVGFRSYPLEESFDPLFDDEALSWPLISQLSVVYVDMPEQDSVRSVARRIAKGGLDWLIYQILEQGGLSQAGHVVVGDGAPWIWNLVAPTGSRASTQ